MDLESFLADNDEQPAPEERGDQLPEVHFLDRVFGPGGVLADAFPGYVPREGQQELTGYTDRAFSKRTNLVAEAPTGTGKTVAYGVPASWWAAKENPERSAYGFERARVLIVTGNNALTKQLVEKDLPMLSKLLPWKFSFAMMKGRQNYLCQSLGGDLPVERMMLTDQLDRKQVDEIQRWSQMTVAGDMAELPFVVRERVRHLTVIGQDDCLGKKCDYHSTCYAEQAKKVAKEADIVVTNYHLFCIDLKLRLDTENEAGVLPDYDIVVFDEAHKMPDIAREFFGGRVTSGGIAKMAAILWAESTPKKDAVHLDKDQRERIVDAARRYFQQLEDYSQSKEYRARIKQHEPVGCYELCDEMRRGADILDRALQTMTFDPMRTLEISRNSDKLRKYSDAIERAMRLDGAEEGWVYSIEPAGKGVALVAKPLDVSDFLKIGVWESKFIRSAVATSATLTTDGVSFKFFKSESGADNAEELVAESPFDWSRQCELVVPPKIVDVKSRDYPTDCARVMTEIAEATNGSMLGLFTSWRVLNVVHQYFVEHGWGDRVMGQKDGPPMQLIERMKREPGSVLLGTESFWAGVDIPGNALQVVCIDRLPFPSPEDPMLDAYEALHGRRAWQDYSMPRAQLALRQGFGRCIRSESDSGIVVVLDRRLVEESYGKRFVRSLPPVKVSRDLVGAIKRKVLPR